MTSRAFPLSVAGPGLAFLILTSVAACEPWPWPWPDAGAVPMPRPDAGPPGDLGARPIDCARWRTVKEMDGFFLQRCGGDNQVCHATSIFGTSFREPDVYRRLLSTPSITCPGINLADRTDHTRGAIWAKTRDTPTCPAGSNAGKSAGVKMPSKAAPSDSAVPLTAEEHRCLESYLRALTERP